ncbi:MAG: FHA domain-containing protein [Actinomycetaceae bacterium]|nr:FHA domain-containing protein [Actinomycetaceae bacterium]
MKQSPHTTDGSRPRFHPRMLAVGVDLFILFVVAAVTWWLFASLAMTVIMATQILIVDAFMIRISHTTIGHLLIPERKNPATAVAGLNYAGTGGAPRPQSGFIAPEGGMTSAPTGGAYGASVVTRADGSLTQAVQDAGFAEAARNARSHAVPPPVAPAPASSVPAPNPAPSAYVPAPEPSPAPPVMHPPAPASAPASTPVSPAPTPSAPLGQTPAALPETPTAVAHSLVLPDGRTFPLHGELRIGRKPSRHLGTTTVELDDPHRTISRNHCVIRCEGNTYRLIDEASANGTEIVRNGQREPVPHGYPVGIVPGDTILIGEFTLRIE